MCNTVLKISYGWAKEPTQMEVSSFEECAAAATIKQVNYGNLAQQCANSLTHLKKLEGKKYVAERIHNGLLIDTYRIVLKDK